MLNMKSVALQGPGTVHEGLALVVSDKQGGRVLSDKQGGRVLPVPELLWVFSAFGPASPFLNCTVVTSRKGCLQGCICH